jgi:SOS-response transcriptional repressor LexA
MEPLTGERVVVPGWLTVGPPGENFVLRVVGDMGAGDHVCDGDLLVLNRRPPSPGDPVVVKIAGNVHFGRMKISGGLGPLQGRDGIDADAGAVDEYLGVLVGLLRRFR